MLTLFAFQKPRRTFSVVSTNALAEEDIDTQNTGSDPIADVTALPDTDISASIASRLQLIEEDFQAQPASRVVSFTFLKTLFDLLSCLFF